MRDLPFIVEVDGLVKLLVGGLVGDKNNFCVGASLFDAVPSGCSWSDLLLKFTSMIHKFFVFCFLCIVCFLCFYRIRYS